MDSFKNDVEKINKILCTNIRAIKIEQLMAKECEEYNKNLKNIGISPLKIDDDYFDPDTHKVNIKITKQEKNDKKKKSNIHFA